MKAIKTLILCVLAALLLPTAAEARVPPRVANFVLFLRGIDTTALKIDGTEVTSTPAELNILDGATLTVAELNILDGVTSTAAELNILDGATLTVAEMNTLDGFTGAYTDLNYVDVTAAGTLEASKAIVVDASSQVDVLDVTGSFKVDGNPIIQCENVTVSSAELLALNATPKELVAAPGANLFVWVHSLYLALDYATTAYDGIAAGEDLTIAYTDGSGADALPPIEAIGFLDQAADTQRYTVATGAVVAGGAATAAIAPVSNAAVVLSMDTGEIATGDSPLDLRICYAVLPDLLD